MELLVVILFAVTLLYLGVTERFRSYVNLIGLQGILLFVLSFINLEKVTLGNLLFVTSETLVFKVLIVPYFLYRIINRTGVAKVEEDAVPGFYSLIFISAGLFISIAAAYSMRSVSVNIIYFIVSFFALYTGLFLIISHKKIFSHLTGFLIIENSVLLLSLAIGREMSMLINIGILLDIFVSVLILGIFAMRLKHHSHELTILKDD